MRMIYQFSPYELDIAKGELRAGAKSCALEPQVFALLVVLVENHDRLVSREELIDKVWDGRVVSDAAVASRVKSARHVLGDDGKSQTFIRTIHGQGFRFVANVRATHGTSGPSLAVLPFRVAGDGGRYSALAFALPAELITELSRLRWLFVTARGSSFRLRASDTEACDIGRLLRVRYCLWGTIELSDRRLAVAVELADTSNGRIVWAERFAGLIDDVHTVRESIRSWVITALEIHIPIHEAAVARLGPTESLDAWSAYHLALQHMYRFNRVDNVTAGSLWAANVRDRNSATNSDHFIRAFPMKSDAMRVRVLQALAQLGL